MSVVCAIERACDHTRLSHAGETRQAHAMYNLE